MKDNHRAPLALLRSSILWGGLVSIGFFGLIFTGTWDTPFTHRYFAGHWVNMVETVLFFIACFELLFKALDVRMQSRRITRTLLGPLPTRPLPISAARDCQNTLATLPHADREGYLGRRLRETLAALSRHNNAEKLDEELKYLAETDALRAHAGYGLVRIIIWAIPILGFLGTVIGITMAIASLNPEQLEQSLPQVTFGLGVAFDTTALALGLSMVLMFGQFQVDRMEKWLLGEVDIRAVDELAGRFETSGGVSSELAEPVYQLTNMLLDSTERTLERQVQLWQETIDAAHGRWSALAAGTQQQLEAALNGALDASLGRHAAALAEAEQRMAERNQRHWHEVQQTLIASTAAMTAQHAELGRQGDLLLEVVNATGQVAKLEDRLNSNLSSLAAAGHLEESLLNLTAAISLLNARLSPLVGGGPVSLSHAPARDRAA